MRDISIFKKIKLFRVFKKRLKEISTELGLKFNIRLDRAYRMYTVINIPEELIGESYSIKKSDVDKISESYIRQYTSELSEFLNSNGLSELFQFYKIERIQNVQNLQKGNKFSYLVVFGFSQFRSDTYYNVIYGLIGASIVLIPSSILAIKSIFF